jgi:type I restriction enzyme R subunit
MPNFISEDQIEQALIKRLKEAHGYEHLNCNTTDSDDINDGSKRRDKREVVFKDRLKDAGIRLNKHIPIESIEYAVAQIADRRPAMSPIAANKELDALIRDGVPVEFEDKDGKKQQERVRFIDFNNKDNNQFLAVTQLWIKGERKYRRPDVLLYINGIPLVFIELKNSNIKLKTAFEDNLTNYKSDIPQLFLTNAVCVLSNALETKVGSVSAGWEHFFNWLKVDDEKETIDRAQIKRDGTSLERLIDGLLRPERLLDYIENFIIYHQHRATTKIIAQNHQFIGVNNAFARFKDREKYGGKLGVFWHTQGSGKSFSMIFYSRKIFRKLSGNFTFVVVTDREDLDDQIYKNFLRTDTVTESDAAQPKDSEEMRRFLGSNKRFVFTLIQKFRFDKGKKYPLLSDRSDIIVIVDEAHRTQYKSLAENMREGLPNAQYLAFTGTPLLGKKRKTNAWFGDYVSEYNFMDSERDGATVKLVYNKRVPEVLIQNEDLSDEFYQILEDENLNEQQITKLEKQFAREVEVIKRDDRLETIAKDIVYHFPRRGYLGKGIVISVDKFTAVKMYDKVQRLWTEQLKELRGRVAKTTNDVEKARYKKMIDYMKNVEMAVVISEEAGEEEKFAKIGLDIKPHRKRMETLDENGHDIEDNFKAPEHPLQLVFVCAMWLTGFDAPTVSTLYLDKPMKDHTLMQTIARANRVTSYQIDGKSKTNGEIIDYINVFRNMKQALKNYAQGEEGLDEAPVADKAQLFTLLDDAIGQGFEFCDKEQVSLKALLEDGNDDIFKSVGKFHEYANAILAKDELRKEFFVYENTITGLYEACKPEILGKPVVRAVAAFQYLRGVIESIIERTDVDKAAIRAGALLDESLVVNNAEGFTVREHEAEYQIIQKGRTWDLSKINFDKLKEEFKDAKYKNIEVTDLRAFIEDKLEKMMQSNATRIDFAQRLQEIVDNYNSGGSSTENYYEDLVRFTQELKEEDERHVREGLSEDELELFDMLKKEKMTEAETQKAKLAAKSLLHRLLEEHPKVLVQDWFKDSQSQKAVRSAVEKVLDENLPETYDRVMFKEKCDNLFELILDYASSGRKWAA